MDRSKITEGMLNIYRVLFDMLDIPLCPTKKVITLIEEEFSTYTDMIYLRKLTIGEVEFIHRNISSRMWAQATAEFLEARMASGDETLNTELALGLSILNTLESCVEHWLLTELTVGGMTEIHKLGKLDTHMVSPTIRDGEVWLAAGSGPEVLAAIADAKMAVKAKESGSILAVPRSQYTH